jgi:GNAT superfamily N-acetyltransferase
MNRHKEKCAESLAGAVLKEYQGNGYGLVLLKKLIDELRLAGLDRVHCDVVEDAKDPAAVKLHRMYQRGGYVQIGVYNVGSVKYVRYMRRL